MSNYVRKETTKNGGIYYYNDKDQFHRLDGPALDGPAIEHANGDKFWYVNGKYHRLDGPAVEWSYGDKEWWVDGKRISEEDWKKHPMVICYNLGKIMKEVLEEV